VGNVSSACYKAHSGGPGQRAVNRFVVVISVMFLPAILMLQYF